MHAVVRAQNNLTQQVLSACDTRSKFKALMTEMYNFPKISCPFQRGEAGGVLRCVTAVSCCDYIQPSHHLLPCYTSAFPLQDGCVVTTCFASAGTCMQVYYPTGSDCGRA